MESAYASLLQLRISQLRDLPGDSESSLTHRTGNCGGASWPAATSYIRCPISKARFIPSVILWASAIGTGTLWFEPPKKTCKLRSPASAAIRGSRPQQHARGGARLWGSRERLRSGAEPLCRGLAPSPGAGKGRRGGEDGRRRRRRSRR